MTTLGDIGEFGFIDRIAAMLNTNPDVIQGIGDDCAVIQSGDRTLLITTDLSIQDIHFTRQGFTPQDIGWKAAAAGLSDIAAMGGIPQFILTSIAAPPDTHTDHLQEIYQGILNAAQHSGATLIGGDTTRSPSGITLDIITIGQAPNGHYTLRSGAKHGDMFAVTGWPGRSAGGLDALQQNIDAPALIQAHLHPTPRIQEGQWLSNHPDIHAMIDLSDGVIQDATHLAQQSNLGIAMTSASVPIDPELALLCPQTDRSLQDYTLTGGEAYELAIAIDPKNIGQTLNDYRQKFQHPIHILGEFSNQFQGILIDSHPPKNQGYKHFS